MKTNRFGLFVGPPIVAQLAGRLVVATTRDVSYVGFLGERRGSDVRLLQARKFLDVTPDKEAMFANSGHGGWLGVAVDQVLLHDVMAIVLCNRDVEDKLTDWPTDGEPKWL